MIALLLVQPSIAAEYRRLELADGRVLVAEVLVTDASGLSLRIPQGRAHVGFDQVLRIDPVDAELYLYQTPVRVLVLPFSAIDAPMGNAQEAADELRVGLGQMPGVRVVPVELAGNQLPAGRIGALAACGLDASCVVGQAAGADVDVVIMGAIAPGEVTMASVFLDAPRAQRRVSGPYGSVEVHAAPWHLLAVDPEPIGAVAAAPRRERRPAPAVSALVPIPGLPAFAQGDVGRGLACVAVTVPVTALVAAAAGSASTHPGEVVLAGAVAWWAASVVTNRALTVAPLPGGVVVSGAF